MVSGAIDAPRYVKKQAEIFLYDADGKSEKYFFSQKKYERIYNILALMHMPEGIHAGKPLTECLAGFQWFDIVATFCIMHRADEDRRRYELSILEIARKNGKTFLIAVKILILMLTEPRFSQFFSVAPDGALSGLVKQAIQRIISVSPALRDSAPRAKLKFRTLRDKIECKITDSALIPLNYSNSRLDGREPRAFLIDEVGALPNSNAIEAMAQGQVAISKNKLGFIISTKYPEYNNPFEAEVSLSKKVLDGIIEDETRFSLLYEPDEEIAKEWATNDRVIFHANPLSLEVPAILASIKKARAEAIEMPSKRQGFCCKHANVLFSGQGADKLVSLDDLTACKTDSPIAWNGREVFVGVDLAKTNDNCAVSIISFDEDTGKMLIKSVAFFPADKLEEKSRIEKVNYAYHVEQGNAVPCGDRIVDYEEIENYILSLPDLLGVKIQAVGFDPKDALRSATALQKAGETVVYVYQYNSILSQPIKLFGELVESKKLEYEENQLFEINADNARCGTDTYDQKYINKKKSNGKIDMVASLMNALYLYQQSAYVAPVMEWGAVY